MSANTPTAGYPAHRVVSFRRWINPNGVRFTDWTSACDKSNTVSGHALGKAGDARRAELCPTCFPGRDHHSYFPDPLDRSQLDAR